MINASPDLRTQIEAHPDLQPDLHPLRNSPIAGVLLTNADLDHVLGLFLLREGRQIDVHANAAIRAVLDQAVGLTSVLNRFCGVTWYEAPLDEPRPLPTTEGANPNLLYRAIPIPAKPPLFSLETTAMMNLAYEFVNVQTERRLIVAPDVGHITEELASAMENCDAVLFDGTFWSGDELASVRTGARTAQDMGHVTIRDCSLKLLAGLAARYKVYVHINNTNPVLSPESPERKAVEAAGIVVGYDGLEFEI